LVRNLSFLSLDISVELICGCVIWGFHGGENHDLRVQTRRLMPTFRRNILSPSSGLKSLHGARTQKNSIIIFGYSLRSFYESMNIKVLPLLTEYRVKGKNWPDLRTNL
jgi:hypothetical protein